MADRGASSSLLSDEEAESKAERFFGGPAGTEAAADLLLRGDRLRCFLFFFLSFFSFLSLLFFLLLLLSRCLRSFLLDLLRLDDLR